MPVVVPPTELVVISSTSRPRIVFHSMKGVIAPTRASLQTISIGPSAEFSVYLAPPSKFRNWLW